jgi:Animal haem peroxidase
VKDPIYKRAFMFFTGTVDRRIGWFRLPKPFALVVLTGIRMKLRRTNLVDPAATPVPWGPEPDPPHFDNPREAARTITGEDNDLAFPKMGSAGEIFGRNVALADAVPQNIVDPNPRVVSERLLARRKFIPATSLNLLAASWLQFEVHDWLSHGFNETDGQFEINLGPDDPWTHERPMLVERTKQGPPTTDGGIPTYRNTETHWWDASQVYGSSPLVEDMLRTRVGGKLRLTPEQLLPFNPATFPLDHEINLAGVAGNWWVGLAMLHTLFMREHNAICDHLAKSYPNWTDDELFDRARLINAAQMAKIHTIEWTPALLTNPALQTAMHANWFGLGGSKLKKLLGRVNLGEELSGIPGSKTYDHGAPYAITEEFIAVYRMHPLIPDDYEFRRAADNSTVRSTGFDQIIGAKVDEVLGAIEMGDLFYSFGTCHPGAIVLHNYPNHLRQFERPDGVTLDLATYDIVKCRERGVPRYNDFRKAFHLNPAKTFEDFSTDTTIVAELRETYAHPDDVDVIVGLFAEAPPPGFAFSDTAFRVFALMASRRLKSDRFYTYDYRPEVYTAEGMQWIDETSMSTVLLRHYPELGPALDGISNAFFPWNVSLADTPKQSAPTKRSLGWRWRRSFWNHVATFKYHHQDPTVIPLPTDKGAQVDLIPLMKAFSDLPIAGTMVGEKVPRDEAQPAKRLFSRLQGHLDHWYSPMKSGIPQVDERAIDALDEAYTKSHRACFPAPVRPVDIDLGTLAAASPYSGYLQPTEYGGFRWDVSMLSQFECHAGLLPLGVVVDFRVNAESKRLEVMSIDTALGSAQPGTAGWDAAQRMAMCSITTHTSLVRHFNWLHLTMGGPVAAATRNHLRASHPVRRLLWPHVFGTQYSNDIVTPLLIGKSGDFETVFSFTHRGMCQLFEATRNDFDIGFLNPLVDAKRRGLNDGRLLTPAQDNHLALYKVFHDHSTRYLALYFSSDDDVRNDHQLGAWVDALETHLPLGLASVVGGNDDAALTFTAMASVLATVIYFATVEHEITGSGLWDYQLWNDFSPVRLYTDGRRVPLDVYQRLVNGDFNLNVRRTMLLDDFSYMALDERGASAFKEFRNDLNGLQLELDRTAPQLWRMEPKRLKANINA